MNYWKTEIKKKIAQDRMKEAIFMILDTFELGNDTEIYNEVILVSLAYHRLDQNFKTALISSEQFNIDLLKTARRLLALVDALPSRNAA